MMGLAVIFHVASAIGFLGLCYVILLWHRQRDLLRRLLSSGRSSVPNKSVAMLRSPGAFITDLCDAAAITLEGRPPAGAATLRKINLGPIKQLFLQSEVPLVRWESNSDELTIFVQDISALEGFDAQLTAALHVKVNIKSFSGGAYG